MLTKTLKLKPTVKKLPKMFGAVLVAGPRQVGKTTMLQKITNGINYVTLDDMIIRAGAQEKSGTLHPLEIKMQMTRSLSSRS